MVGEGKWGLSSLLDVLPHLLPAFDPQLSDAASLQSWFVASCSLWRLCSALSGCRQSAQEAEEKARQQHDALEVARVACREEEEQLHGCASVPRCPV